MQAKTERLDWGECFPLANLKQFMFERAPNVGPELVGIGYPKQPQTLAGRCGKVREEQCTGDQQAAAGGR